LLKQARAQAEDIKREAKEEAERVQVGADNYVRQVLTDLSESLQRQLASINKGLDSLK
jgi:F0F1-type ATP synthase membrane subunit b/b'